MDTNGYNRYDSTTEVLFFVLMQNRETDPKYKTFIRNRHNLKAKAKGTFGKT